jgi:hypothetical protein
VTPSSGMSGSTLLPQFYAQYVGLSSRKRSANGTEPSSEDSFSYSLVVEERVDGAAHTDATIDEPVDVLPEFIGLGPVTFAVFG